MINYLLKKLKSTIYVLAVAAGIICLACACIPAPKVPKGVKVNGIEVGGLIQTQAAKKIREITESELKVKTLEVRGQNKSYKFTFPEIYYKDDVYSVLKNAQKGNSYTAHTSIYLCGINEIADGICLDERRLKVEPYAEFRSAGAPFEYFEGQDGIEVDKIKLISDIKSSLNDGFKPVTVAYKAVKRQKSVKEVIERTRFINGFTTYFDASNTNRASNISLAASKLNGAVIESGKTLSFNDTVGARLAENGFLPAKIIEKGEFVEGIGGGVCQVSTTLYNAALLSGLEVVEYHPHSLAVSYVAPSRDAMVSGTAFDLKIKNNGKTPIYIRSKAQNGSVTFCVYGLKDGNEYSFKSNVTGSVPAPEEQVDDPAKARNGKDGLLSEGYLEITKNGYKKSVLIRKDKYAPVKKLTYPDSQSQEQPFGQNAQPEVQQNGQNAA